MSVQSSKYKSLISPNDSLLIVVDCQTLTKTVDLIAQENSVGTSKVHHEPAVERMVQAESVPVTARQVIFEWRRGVNLLHINQCRIWRNLTIQANRTAVDIPIYSSILPVKYGAASRSWRMHLLGRAS